MEMKEYIVSVGDKGNMNMIENGLHLQQLVRCKDCKHYHKGFNCDLLQKPFNKDVDWFCADGDRREQNDD